MNDWPELNRQRVADAMRQLYLTYIVDEAQAKLRGQAIRTLDALLITLGGAKLSNQIESVPWSKRMRDSGELELQQVEREMRKHFTGED